jgi:hypothetical protein
MEFDQTEIAGCDVAYQPQHHGAAHLPERTDSRVTIRQELDDAHRRRHAPAIKDTARKSLSGLSSNQRT